MLFRLKRTHAPGADPGFFLGGGALVSCLTSTPINPIVFFCRIPVVLENRRSLSRVGGGVRPPPPPPLHPPPRSAPARILDFRNMQLCHNRTCLMLLLFVCFCFKRIYVWKSAIVDGESFLFYLF